MASKPGSTNKRAGDQPAAGPVHQPADIDGKLLRLGTRQQGAVVQRLQESVLADPLLLLDEMRCITAIWPAGPPKESAATRAQTRIASPKGTP